MKYTLCAKNVCLVLLVLISCTVTLSHAFEDDALWLDDNIFSMESTDEPTQLSKSTSDKGVISKMIERGKILWKSIPRTGLKLAGRVFDYVPKPETIFRFGKHALVGLPQELIAYAVNSVCKCFKRFM